MVVETKDEETDAAKRTKACSPTECYLVKDEATCMSSMDRRPKFAGPCAWSSAGTFHSGDRCLPSVWVLAHDQEREHRTATCHVPKEISEDTGVEQKGHDADIAGKHQVCSPTECYLSKDE